MRKPLHRSIQPLRPPQSIIQWNPHQRRTVPHVHLLLLPVRHWQSLLRYPHLTLIVFVRSWHLPVLRQQVPTLVFRDVDLRWLVVALGTGYCRSRCLFDRLDRKGIRPHIRILPHPLFPLIQLLIRLIDPLILAIKRIPRWRMLVLSKLRDFLRLILVCYFLVLLSLVLLCWYWRRCLLRLVKVMVFKYLVPDYCLRGFHFVYWWNKFMIERFCFFWEMDC
jgi:hypothetical protein